MTHSSPSQQHQQLLPHYVLIRAYLRLDRFAILCRVVKDNDNTVASLAEVRCWVEQALELARRELYGIASMPPVRAYLLSPNTSSSRRRFKNDQTSFWNAMGYCCLEDKGESFSCDGSGRCHQGGGGTGIPQFWATDIGLDLGPKPDCVANELLQETGILVQQWFPNTATTGPIFVLGGAKPKTRTAASPIPVLSTPHLTTNTTMKALKRIIQTQKGIPMQQQHLYHYQSSLTIAAAPTTAAAPPPNKNYYDDNEYDEDNTRIGYYLLRKQRRRGTTRFYMPLHNNNNNSTTTAGVCNSNSSRLLFHLTRITTPATAAGTTTTTITATPPQMTTTNQRTQYSQQQQQRQRKEDDTEDTQRPTTTITTKSSTKVICLSDYCLMPSTDCSSNNYHCSFPLGTKTQQQLQENWAASLLDSTSEKQQGNNNNNNDQPFAIWLEDDNDPDNNIHNNLFVASISSSSWCGSSSSSSMDDCGGVGWLGRHHPDYLVALRDSELDNLYERIRAHPSSWLFL